jgi:ubiquinone/menaquinone biosynthesis C-methylase UbiE
MDVREKRHREIERYAQAYKLPKYRMGDKRKRHAQAVLERLPKGSLLDVGAGRGEGIQLARKAGHEPAVGVEPVDYLAYGAVMVGVATDLPFNDGDFDTVMCLDVLEHLVEEDVEPALHEMYRVARNQVFLTAAENSHNVRGIGEMHISRRPADEWRALFEKVFKGAEIEPLGKIGVSPGWLIWI